jgi:preprotein translocase subunit SecY
LEWYFSDHYDWIIARFPFAIAGEFMAVWIKQWRIGCFSCRNHIPLPGLCDQYLVSTRYKKDPVLYAKRIIGNKQYGGVRQYIPLKVNAAGVMPIIFAQAIMFLSINFCPVWQ